MDSQFSCQLSHPPPTFDGMDSRSLTPEQARKLAEQIERHVAYFYHLRRRLEALGFEQSDMLLQMVAKTHDLQSFWAAKNCSFYEATGVIKRMSSRRAFSVS